MSNESILSENIYMRGHSMIGGHLSEIPLPHIRKFPNPYVKREVTVTVSRYYGIGIHYYVSIQEEDNPIWNGNAWQVAWDDKEAEGKTDTKLFFDGELDANIRVEAYEIAIGRAKKILKKYFPNHEVKWDDFCENYEQNN